VNAETMEEQIAATLRRERLFAWCILHLAIQPDQAEQQRRHAECAAHDRALARRQPSR